MADPAVRVSGNGPAITWLHGYTMDCRIWESVWPHVPGYRHLGVDLPGHGRSAPLPASAPMSAWAQAVEDTMTANDSTLLVALCMGTMVAAEVAIRGRVSLDRLVLVAPALVGMDEDLPTANRFRSLAIRAMRGAGRAELADLWMRPPAAMFAGLARYPDRLAALRAVIADHTWPDLLQFGPAAFRERPQTVAELAAAPVGGIQVISGGLDMPAHRATALALAAGVPGGVLDDHPELGHLPLLEDPPAVAAGLVRFLGAGQGAPVTLAQA